MLKCTPALHCHITFVILVSAHHYQSTMDNGDDLLVSMAMMQLALLTAGSLLVMAQPRNPSFFDRHLMWEEYCHKHTQWKTFKVWLRMSKSSFDKLLGCVRDELVVNEVQVKPTGGAIIPELCLYCTIRWLAGGSYLDICDISGISKSSFYRVVWKTIRVIVGCQGLDNIQWPVTQEAIQEAIEGFATISTQGVISNCAGVVDGYLLRIKVPGKKEVGNVRLYFSGHYQCYDVNVQACCDHLSHFTYIAMTAPGVTGDHIAIHECSLYELIEKLPFGICVMGDATYEATEHMVLCHQNLDRCKPWYYNYNYHCSQ
jgi:hypothetical protein